MPLTGVVGNVHHVESRNAVVVSVRENRESAFLLIDCGESRLVKVRGREAGREMALCQEQAMISKRAVIREAHVGLALASSVSILACHTVTILEKQTHMCQRPPLLIVQSIQVILWHLLCRELGGKH